MRSAHRGVRGLLLGTLTLMACNIWLVQDVSADDIDAVVVKAVPRPNIVFILTDAHRWDGLSCAGNEFLQTPNLDRIAGRGTRFRNAFVTQAKHSSTRAACLTGRYGNARSIATDHAVSLRNPGRSFAHALRAAGYLTGVAGKWHLNNSPEDCGFEFASTFWSDGAWYDRDFRIDGRQQKTRGFVDDVVAEESARFVHSALSQKKPFVLWLCTQVPHCDQNGIWPADDEHKNVFDLAQMPVPANWNDELNGKPDILKTSRNRILASEFGYEKTDAIARHLRDYYAAVEQMDIAIGRFLDELESLQLQNNTWFILMGDNGWLLGEHGMAGNGLPYEESIRIPMAISAPSIAPRVCDELVLNIDIAATIYELAGLEPPSAVHGKSLVPLVGGITNSKWRDRVLIEVPAPEAADGPVWTLRDHRWKYIETVMKDSLDQNGTRDRFVELYDLQNDPGEMHNLASKEAAVLEILAEQLRRQVRSLNETDTRTKPTHEPSTKE
ncbi:MAG: sulfatase-like hydrolase/transferase [Planctomycetaceae bacterium]